ncbi:hypothetical protein [uncultured Megasphaera sp.]|uniref:hypothetical protein n=1 Tax=uncultured Megasphaera sp. TaxID=165188 RepID=UPI0025CC42B2|nr:hypothetical protein [uncultured Megasphaera sp.]
MISDGYASTLKKLIAFTQAKFISLADVVGYDVSYVNKWSNGTKLPSSRYVERINEEMGQYFAELIQKQKKEAKFFKAFPISENTEDLGFEIGQYLCSAYRTTLHQNRAPKNKENRPSIQVITGHHDTSAFLSDLLQKSIQNLEEDGELLVLGEFSTICSSGFWKYFDGIQLKNKLVVRVGLDLDKLESDPEALTDLYRTLDEYLDIDFVFYDIKESANANLIILKGAFVVQYALDTQMRFKMCTYIFDESMVWDIYEKFSFTGSEQKAIMSTASSLGLDELGYRTAFYATSRFFFYLTIGFEFLLPHEVFDSISQNASPEQAFSIQRLCVTWEEVLNASEITFMMPTTSLLRYVESGYIYLTDIEYHLTASERQDHIQSVLDGMEKNPKLTMGVLLPSVGDDAYMGKDLSFYSNYKTGFLKKNKRNIHNNADSFYIISSNRLHSLLLNAFQNMKNQPSYRQYDHEALKKKYETYKPLIERTLSLSQ